VNTLQPLNPSLQNESSSKPSDSLPNSNNNNNNNIITPNESNIDGKFNSHSGLNEVDDLQIREDIIENDGQSPIKNDNE